MTFAEILDQFEGLRALVVGDLMLDEYIFGRATRISPEAPVMVIRQERTAHVPGGAANVARNLAALGAEARVAGVVGRDEAGVNLADVLRSGGVLGVGLVEDPSRSTTRKTRVLADSAHQVLRIDSEVDSPLADEVAFALVSEAVRLLADSDVLVLSDYQKGALTPHVINALIGEAHRRGIPVVANAKPRSFSLFRGASLVSLNRAEATQTLSLAQPLDRASAADAAHDLARSIDAEAVLITLGEGGMAVASASGEVTLSVPAAKVEVYDTAGAGDTVIATVALGMAVNRLAPEVFRLAAQTSAAVVRKVGVAIPTAEDLILIRAQN